MRKFLIQRPCGALNLLYVQHTKRVAKNDNRHQRMSDAKSQGGYSFFSSSHVAAHEFDVVVGNFIAESIFYRLDFLAVKFQYFLTD